MANLHFRNRKEHDRAEFALDNLYKLPGHPSPREAHLQENQPTGRHNAGVKTSKVPFQRKIGKAGGGRA
ncbi:hypothetical protein PP175_09695 [Aneurinibacillus sp. Ricciae_BoGa-3]|uniref:hypothetical protein n=1 Tax=Aneurinibacillus sp. Ricciae_BoGa-3 TaxID=3022697 RepID=UPI002342817D|nr:hypothetical protein [Aneurinibacillus sp. Ricciae_BoGa-3]WCK56154.1 hypothetical protein PP175_09695 [Aneurinibacillus sp. Ricciae_BoGa-3]